MDPPAFSKPCNHGIDARAGEGWWVWHPDDRPCGQLSGWGSAMECSVQRHQSGGHHQYPSGFPAE